ncbi:MAG: hypothetical protein HXX10_11890 [Rhodoplanes sp.]|uniref:hypothetical protein n=1 Tax=Rhodoplanes sp. TaxID=1968906 RepID=UPI0017E07224|nr:hypothetical protein [Rhodoplanes sp.]NVO14729.1 hypothetical protein [Rhodoplanes sp.]
MPEPPPAVEDSTPQSVAAYIADLTGDLARIARRHGLQTLGYLLEMAHIEAEATSEAGRDRGRANGAPSP